MFFSAISVALLVGSTFGSPVAQKRDVQTITDAIGKVNTAVQGLDGAVKGFNGDANSAQPILDKASSLQDVIKSSTMSIQGTSAVSLNDALTIQGPANSVGGSINTTVDDLIAQKPKFDMAMLTDAVRQQLQTQATSSQPFADAIVSKLPAAAQAIAKNSASSITTSLNRAVTAFGGMAQGN